jgi:hypothetical protein
MRLLILGVWRLQDSRTRGQAIYNGGVFVIAAEDKLIFFQKFFQAQNAEA